MKITEITESINFYDRFGHDTGAQALPYTVEVRDRETGGKKLISIQAVSAADARERARDRGYRVVRVVSQDESVEEGLNEMDKSAPQPGRDGKISHSTYGSRDKKGSDYFKGKEAPGRPITKKQAAKDALDILKKSGIAEGQLDPYRLERLDPQSRRVLQRMADHAEPGSWLSASEAYAIMLGLQYKRQDPRGWEQEVQHYVDLWNEITGKKS